MKQLKATFICEIIKLKRSMIFWITLGLFIFIPLMMGLLMYVAQHPETASKLGLIGTKASLFGENDWEGYLTVINQIIATVGLIGFGFVIAWVFGREYIERTIIDILALPVSRTSIVIAKFLITSIWSVLLSILLFTVSIIIGFLIDIPGFSEHLLIQNSKIFFFTSFLTILLCTPIAFIACLGRGILAPTAFVISMLIIAQFTALLGIGPYFPWAIPGVNTVPPETQGMDLVSASYIIVILTSLSGFFGTVAWWRFADQH